MKKRSRRVAVPSRRIIKVGAKYLDTYHSIVVTVEDHEIVAGRRTGRLVVIGADGVERFPRRWYTREQDLVELPSVSLPLRGAHP
jgi:hypothetical protein